MLAHGIRVSVHVQIHTIIYPQNGGPHFGVYRIAHRIMVPGTMIEGFEVVSRDGGSVAV